MNLQNQARNKAGFAIAFLIIALSTVPSVKARDKRQFNPFGALGSALGENPLGALGAFGLALGAGNLLGQALGGLGRGNSFGRRRRRGGRRYGGWGGRRYGGGGGRRWGGWGIREVEDVSDDPLDKMEENIISDMFELMMNTDPDDCYRRWICDIATREQGFSSAHPFLSFVSDDEDLFIPKRFEKFSEQLKLARQVGEDAEGHQVCEDTFQCPFTGEKMTELMKEKFPDETNDGLTSTKDSQPATIK